MNWRNWRIAQRTVQKNQYQIFYFVQFHKNSPARKAKKEFKISIWRYYIKIIYDGVIKELAVKIKTIFTLQS